jgi:hypothetical protein
MLSLHEGEQVVDPFDEK